MPIRPEEFYAAAKALNRLRPPLISDEVCARTMSSRMYYAAYLAIREAIRVQVGDLTFDTTLTSLLRALTHAADPEVRAVGARLKRLKTIREDSDYHVERSISMITAALHLGHAQYVLDNAQGLMGRFPPVRGR